MSLPDTFTGAPGLTLSEYDALWVKNPSTQYLGVLKIGVTGEYVVSSDSYGASYYYNQAPASADYDVSADITFVDQTSAMAVAGRMRVDGENTMYFARWNAGVQLFKFVSNTVTQLGSTASQAVANGSTHNIRLSMAGSTIKVFFDGVEKISVTDSAISSVGYAGVRAVAGNTSKLDNFDVSNMGGGGSTTTTISATLANITGSVTSISAPKTAISATLANVTGSIASGSGSLVTTIAATLGNVVGAITSTGSTANGTFTSEVLKDYAGNALVSVSMNFVRLYNQTTGALVLSKTGVSTNASGVVSFTDAALTAGTGYRIDWETSTGSRRMPIKAAT